MAQFTQLSEEDLGAIARAFRLGPLRQVTPVVAGTVNTNLRVESERGLWFVRVNEGKAEDEVAYEGELACALGASGVPLALPLRAGDATYARLALESGPALVSAFRWIPGTHRMGAALREEEMRAVGGALARMHRAGQGFPLRRTSRYQWPAICERWQRIRDEVARLDAEAAAELDAETRAIADAAAERAALPTGVIHGDLFPDNVLFADEGGIAALLDFEQASDGCLAYDLAVVLCSWCFDQAFVWPRAAALIAGYQAERELTPAERLGLWREARAAAARFTVTRLTDVELDPRVGPETRRAKDWRRFLARSRALRTLGAAGFAAELGLG